MVDGGLWCGRINGKGFMPQALIVHEKFCLWVAFLSRFESISMASFVICCEVPQKPSGNQDGNAIPPITPYDGLPSTN